MQQQFPSKHQKSMKMAVFWVVASCSLLEVCRRFALMMEAVSTSEIWVNIYQTIRRNNPEDSHLHTRSRENLKSHLSIISRNNIN
jgi:hypothetical protein